MQQRERELRSLLKPVPNILNLPVRFTKERMAGTLYVLLQLRVRKVRMPYGKRLRMEQLIQWQPIIARSKAMKRIGVRMTLPRFQTAVPVSRIFIHICYLQRMKVRSASTVQWSYVPQTRLKSLAVIKRDL